MNPENVADYAAVLTDPHDGCQWNPYRKRGSLVDDRHYRKTKAAFVVGATISYRVCAACAASPKWKDHKQVRIER